MAVYSGPEISQNGLVLCLDATNTRSYPGSGTTWFDLSGFNHNVTLINSPTYFSSNGRFKFDGTSSYATTPSTSTLTTTTPTVIIGCSVASGTVLAKGAFGVYWNYGITGVTGTTFKARNNNTDITSPSFSDTVSGINIFAVVWNGSTCVFYRNGVSSGTNNSGYTPTATNSRDITIGNAYSNNTTSYVEYYSGEISFIHVYNRALSAAEIEQHFRALRGRFQL